MRKERRQIDGEITFSTKVLEQLGCLYANKKESRPRLYDLHIIYSKWIIYTHVKCPPIKRLGENMGENLHNLRFGYEFLTAFVKKKKMANRNGI